MGFKIELSMREMNGPRIGSSRSCSNLLGQNLERDQRSPRPQRARAQVQVRDWHWDDRTRSRIRRR